MKSGKWIVEVKAGWMKGTHRFLTKKSAKTFVEDYRKHAVGNDKKLVSDPVKEVPAKEVPVTESKEVA